MPRPTSEDHNLNKILGNLPAEVRKQEKTRMIIQHTVKVVDYAWKKFVKLVTLLPLKLSKIPPEYG